ncbi:VOC family protein [Fulvivirga sp. RKSG066]|uniref:VOC family protein n=1 Tax=Fulvivirga aurantia TaxID=2529383 RepID=UPI0012BC490A|nr:VOC family protein [Fulvivirga aurantia]MTI19649.1 VOC family protein [Fulvivirga aurantia]
MKKPYLGLRTAIYYVPNLNEAKEWYAKAFETQPYFDEPFYVGFNIGGYELGLLPTENKSEEKSEAVVAYWGVNDAQASYDQLLAHGASSHGKPTDVGGGIITAEVKDPYGNVIGIIHNPHFKLEG